MSVTIDARSPTEPVIVMTRVFDAPRELVWEASTNPEHVKRWYGGHGFSNPICEMDVRPGGLWRHIMRSPAGVEYAMTFVFVEVMRPERIAWQHIDHGKNVPGGLPTSLMTITLTDLGNKTGWRLVTRFSSMADRDRANEMGFASTLAQGTDRFNDVAKSLRLEKQN